MAFIVKRRCVDGGWKLYRLEDRGDPYLLFGEVMATSDDSMDDILITTGKMMLMIDIQNGQAELIRSLDEPART